jgi:NAD-dependent SIR2 family protein deacetylase
MDPLQLISVTMASINTAVTAGRVIVTSNEALSAAELKLKMSEMLLALADANTQLAELRNTVKEVDQWERTQEMYELYHTSAGARIFKWRGEPSHFSCPRCFIEKKQAFPMQGGAHLVQCPACMNNYQISHAPAISYSALSDHDPFIRR